MVRIALLLLAALSLFFSATPVLAQNTTEPTCAAECVTSAAEVVNCAVNDTACQCASTTFAFTAGNCLGANCQPSELAAARTYFIDRCNVGSSSSTSTSTTSRASSTSTSSTSTSAPSSTATSPASTSSSATSPSPAAAAASASSSGQPSGATHLASSHGWVFGGAVLALAFLGA
ncbi:hypothetical protein OF83DRAFT_1293649 [Amylostereum chailletii]|nr:hypothetical protein OF83DRAFT_1293649 [Amylostereum chailletii]